MKRIDLTGQRFGKLIVIEMLYGYKNKHTYCKCRCDCGNITIVCRANLVSGRTQSCGCLEKESRYNRPNHEKNLLGMQFGHLTVIGMSEKRASNGQVIWICECDCGNIVYVKSGHLLRGKTRSCGCNKTSKYEEWVENILNELKISYKREYRFHDCRNHYPLPFDFYISDYNGCSYCIECQGQQHYDPVEHFGGMERFYTVQHNDQIKRDYCLANRIVLLSLPYTMTQEEMKNAIINILDPVTTTVA